MKTYLLLSLFFVSCLACNKDDKLTKSESYANLVYRVQTTDSFLQLYFLRAVYNDSVKGNIGKDTILTFPSLYSIPATVLKGYTVTLKGISTRDSMFNLKIVDANGAILAQTDTITRWPITPFDPQVRYVSDISVYLP